MKKVDFIILGAQKAGTSSLHRILNYHPDIFIPKGEINFFNFSENFNKGINWYLNNVFTDRKNEKIIGERSTWYLPSKEAPKRIYDSFGKNIKFIIIFRHPLQRAFSHYLMIRRIGNEHHSFEKAIENELKLSTNSNYLKWGKYAEQLENYLRYFDEKQFKFVLFENFIQFPKNTIEEIFQFLSVNNYIVDYNLHANKAIVPRNRINIFVWNKLRNNHLFLLLKNKILANDIILKNLLKIILFKGKKTVKISLKNKLLHDYYKNDIKKLEKITGLDLSNWR
jgi:hypothetical protein